MILEKPVGKVMWQSDPLKNAYSLLLWDLVKNYQTINHRFLFNPQGAESSDVKAKCFILLDFSRLGLKMVAVNQN